MSELIQGDSRLDTMVRAVTFVMLLALSGALVWTTLSTRNEPPPAVVSTQ